MARLPDETVLGPAPSAASRRSIATLDGSAAITQAGVHMGETIARGGAAIAQGLGNLGEGAKNLGTGLANYQKAQDDFALKRGEAEYHVRKAQLDEEFENDREPATMRERYEKRLVEITAGIDGAFDRTPVKERFKVWSEPRNAYALGAVQGRANKLSADIRIADATEKLTQLRERGLTASDPIVRDETIKTAHGLITTMANAGDISATAAQALRQKWTEDYAASYFRLKPAAEQVRLLSDAPPIIKQTATSAGEAALIWRESSGRPGLVNTLGYAGMYQYGAPRLQTLGLYKPGEAEDMDRWSKTNRTTPGKWSGTFSIPGFPEVKTLDQFLASPAAQKAAFERDRTFMDKEIANLGLEKYVGQTVGGVPITRDGLYAMMHLGGAGGAKRVLESNGAVNPKDAYGTGVLDYARLGLPEGAPPGGKGTLRDFLPETRRVELLQTAQGEVTREQHREGTERALRLERQFIDAAAGKAEMPSREAIEADPLLEDRQRNALLKMYDTATADAAGYREFAAKFNNPNGGPFNPFETATRDNADKMYAALGGDLTALQTVVNRVGFVPKSGAMALRGEIVSNNPARVAAAMQIVSNLLTRTPHVFVKSEGASDLENAAVAFRHSVEDLGLSAEAAARKYIEQQSPEYAQKVKAKIKPEDVQELVKKNLAVSDLTSAFNEGWPGIDRPSIEFDPRSRLVAFGNYAELFKERYLETGDVGQAKKQAIEQLKSVWRVSFVNGSRTGVVMPYPPEHAPAYAGIENLSDHIAKQALAAIKAETGYEPERKSLRFDPIPGFTAPAYKGGQPVPYQIGWQDKNGVVHTLNPGRGFVFDPAKARADQEEARRVGLATAAAERAPALEAMQQHRELVASRRQQRREAIESQARDADARLGETGGRF